MKRLEDVSQTPLDDRLVEFVADVWQLVQSA